MRMYMNRERVASVLGEDQSNWPSVAIVVLNWNNYEDTATCLQSLKSVEYPNLDVIVVDNGSSDNSAYRLQRDYNWCNFVLNNTNKGFAKGVNSGIKGRTNDYDYFLLFNNDMTMENDTVCSLIYAAEKTAGIGIVSPKTVYEDNDEIQTAGRRFKKTTLSFENIHNGINKTEISGIMEVDAVSGGCMLLNTKMINDIGTFCESFFFGGEDVEYCIRARQHNWSIILQADTLVKHKPHSTHGTSRVFNQYHSTKNHIRLGLKTGTYGKIGILNKLVSDFLRVLILPLLSRGKEAQMIVMGYFDLLLKRDKKRTELL